ncbi:trichohyalin-like [Boleophthalmus pectinirostris]|uniref:trichohyalin-like n=1 Tax=Boleophthalmus pectinirostris TaxID=150288 RepID=UPI0024326911|nr:trichohyalin-like [Boleophthalmus pectinirostris]
MAQISDLDQALVRQEQEHKTELEKAKKEQEERIDRKVKMLMWQRRQVVEEEEQALLLSQWRREQEQNDRCREEIADAQRETDELRDDIKLLRDQQREIHLRTHTTKQKCEDMRKINQTLKQEMGRLSRKLKDLSKRKLSLNEEKVKSEELTDKLRDDYRVLCLKREEQRVEILRLKEEEKRARRRRTHNETNLRIAIDVLREIIEVEHNRRQMRRMPPSSEPASSEPHPSNRSGPGSRSGRVPWVRSGVGRLCELEKYLFPADSDL